jgi:hypothetical protein
MQRCSTRSTRPGNSGTLPRALQPHPPLAARRYGGGVRDVGGSGTRARADTARWACGGSCAVAARVDRSASRRRRGGGDLRQRPLRHALHARRSRHRTVARRGRPRGGRRLAPHPTACRGAHSARAQARCPRRGRVDCTCSRARGPWLVGRRSEAARRRGRRDDSIFDEGSSASRPRPRVAARRDRAGRVSSRPTRRHRTVSGRAAERCDDAHAKCGLGARGSTRSSCARRPT